ncbi:MAG TPA: prolyl oligopeptidase family serine peptidase [Gemmatimonadales bacterium]|nr:prolyl oligopeptidase family serine peptidase [Gemmatimonadales bacterium]
MTNLLRALVALSLPSLAADPAAALQSSHSQPGRPGVVDTLHGVPVPDPHRWLEDMGAPEVVAYARTQDSIARAYLPAAERAALRKEIAEIARVERYGAPLKRGDRHFYLRFPASGPGTSPGTALLLREGERGAARLLIDPAALPAGAALAWAIPDPHGRQVAYLVTRPGSAWGTVRIREVESGGDLADSLVGLRAAGSGLSWSPRGDGLFYERYDLPEAEDERSARVAGERIAFHRLGERQDQDAVVFQAPSKEAWSLAHLVTGDGRYLVITSTDGATQHSRLHYRDLRDREGRVVELIGGAGATHRFVGNRGTTFWIWTDLEAPRGRVVAIDLRAPARARWVELIPQADATISSWIGATAIGDRIVVGYLEDARTEVRVFDGRGRLSYRLDLPREGSIWSGFVGSQQEPVAFYSLSGLVDPGTVYRLDVRTGESRVFQRPALGYDPDEFVTEQVFLESRDGTRLPMFLVHARGVRPGPPRPALMYGYGFGAWTAAPWFQPHMAVWLRRGGIWAVPNTRGGGEYGEEWHRAGSGLRKQNAIDDYLAAARWLIAEGWTTADLLVANGSSAGGAVVGAALVQQPDLFGAVVLDYPVLDMLRYDRFTVADRWQSEYGTVRDPAEFRALLAYSPVHNIERGVCYPPTLVSPGERDDVTPPFHAYKLVAALRDAQACDRPVHLRVSWGAGHSSGATLEDSIDTWADQLAFMYRVLGGGSPER